MVKVQSHSLSECFYTIDTYGTFSLELLDDDWFEESEFDNEDFMRALGELHVEVIENVIKDTPIRSVKLIDTSSPSYYNFSTDQAELEIEVDLPELLDYIKKNEGEFEKFIDEEFSSRSGFWSFTPNNLKDWYAAVADEDANCITIMAGWYLTREEMTEDDYMDTMYDKIREVMWDYFEQFTTETWDQYDKYKEEFERVEREQAKLELDDKHFPNYVMEIDEWYKEVKMKEVS